MPVGLSNGSWFKDSFEFQSQMMLGKKFKNDGEGIVMPSEDLINADNNEATPDVLMNNRLNEKPVIDPEYQDNDNTDDEMLRIANPPG